MRQKTEKKDGCRPKCTASRLGYEQTQKSKYYCFYLGHIAEVTFEGGTSERRPTNTTHHPATFHGEAMRVSAKPLQGEWMGLGRWARVTK